MKINELIKNKQIKLHRYACKTEAAEALANKIVDLCPDKADQNTEFSLAFSGGSTPKPLFEALTNKAIPWLSSWITLVDDRVLDVGHVDSNERMLTEELLNKIPKAQYLSLTQTDIASARKQVSQLPLDISIAVLGMGNDGHTASIFPCSTEINLLLNSTNPLEYVSPKTANYKRITMTPSFIMKFKYRLLHISGDDKLATLEQALDGYCESEMPIRSLLKKPIEIFWSP